MQFKQTAWLCIFNFNFKVSRLDSYVTSVNKKWLKSLTNSSIKRVKIHKTHEYKEHH